MPILSWPDNQREQLPGEGGGVRLLKRNVGKCPMCKNSLNEDNQGIYCTECDYGLKAPAAAKPHKNRMTEGDIADAIADVNTQKPLDGGA